VLVPVRLIKLTLLPCWTVMPETSGVDEQATGGVPDPVKMMCGSGDAAAYAAVAVLPRRTSPVLTSAGTAADLGACGNEDGPP
jgi:hypothetical protein